MQEALALEGSQGQGVLGHTIFAGLYNLQDDRPYWVLEYNHSPHSYLKDCFKVLCKAGEDSTKFDLVVHTQIGC